MRELTILTEFLHTIVDAPIVSEICVSLIEESLYHLAHVWYQSRDRRYSVCSADIESVEIFEKCFRVELGKFSEALTRLLTITDRLIVDIGDIHDGPGPISEKSEGTDDEVLEEIGTEIAYMSVVIRCRSTVVYLHFILFEWLESFFGSGERIVEVKRHVITIGKKL